MDALIPLDPRPDACEITELAELRSVETAVTLGALSVKEIKSLAIDPNTLTIGEIDFGNKRLATAFIVGDVLYKVNNIEPVDLGSLAKLLAAPGENTIIVKRRAFASPPSYSRVKAAMTALKLSVQKRSAYAVVTCKKMPFDHFLSATFGFTAEHVTMGKSMKKFVIAEININTAAEKYFSVGDFVLDLGGTPIPHDGSTLRQFNARFQSAGEIEVLVERPVTGAAREAVADQIREHLNKHDTPAMCEEVARIGARAALYHDLLWKRLVPVPITAPPRPSRPAADCPTTPEKKGSKQKKDKKPKKGKKKTKKKKKGTREEETCDAPTTMEGGTTIDGDASPHGARIKILGAKSYQEITSDVEASQTLESVGLRYTDDFDDENTADDEEVKKKKKAKKASKSHKKGLFSSMAHLIK